MTSTPADTGKTAAPHPIVNRASINLSFCWQPTCNLEEIQRLNTQREFLELAKNQRLNCKLTFLDKGTEEGQRQFDDLTEGDHVSRFPMIVASGNCLSFNTFGSVGELEQWLKNKGLLLEL